MEMIRKAPGAIAVSSTKMFIRSALWMLDFVYSCVGTVATTVPNLREEKLSFSLGFPNGETQEIEVSKNNYDSYESKRMKLVLDISVLPNDNYKVLSAENLPRSIRLEGTLPQRMVDNAAYYTLKSIQMVQLILKEVEHFVDDSSMNLASQTNGSLEDRKRKSPRKRLPESRTRPIRRFLTRVWEILGYVQPDNILFDPTVAQNGDTSFNTSMNGANSKLEKRKQPESSENEFSEDDDDTLNLQNDEDGSPPQDNASDVYEAPEEANKQDLNTSNISVSETELSQTEEKQNYFELEEDYASADDPDYQPSSPSRSSSGSSISDDNSEHLLEEITELKKDMETPYMSQSQHST